MNKIFQSLVVLLVVSFSLSPLLVSHAMADGDSWTAMEPLPMGSWGIVGVNDKIYAIAGSGSYANSAYENNAVLEFSPVTDMWTVKKPMPTKRHGFATAVYQNKIYVIGGPEGVNQVYDPATDTWETKTSMPTPREQLEANVVNGKIYLIGGRTGGQFTTVSLNEVYDPSTDTWTTKEPIPYPVVLYASAVVDDKIYVIGGQDEFHDPMNLDLTQIYDPETDAWSFGAPIPNVVWQAAAGATTGVMAPKKIYVIGGLPDESMMGTNINQVYNPENDSWTVGTSMPTARFQLHVAVVHDKLYAIGGLPYFNLQGVSSNENEQYTPMGYGTVPPAVHVVSPENKTYTVNRVSLTFNVNKPTSWIGYSLDGQANVTITENTTLSGLSYGSHNLIVYANDTDGNTGTSETIYFSIKIQPSDPFPTWVVAATVIVAIAAVGAALLVYFWKVKKTTEKAE